MVFIQSIVFVLLNALLQLVNGLPSYPQFAVTLVVFVLFVALGKLYMVSVLEKW